MLFALALASLLRIGVAEELFVKAFDNTLDQDLLGAIEPELVELLADDAKGRDPNRKVTRWVPFENHSIPASGMPHNLVMAIKQILNQVRSEGLIKSPDALEGIEVHILSMERRKHILLSALRPV